MPRVKRYEQAVPVLEAELLEAIERDRMTARALDLEAAQRIQDIRRQAAASQGLDAETAAAGARKAIAETHAEFAGRATSPRMRAMLEDVLERRAALVDDELTAHTERARTAASIDGALQRRQLARQDALDAITPHAFDIHHQTMLDAIDEHGRLVGLDPAEIAANRLRASSAVHADRTAARLDAGDVDGAIGWRDANLSALSAADAARLDALLAEPLAEAASRARVDRVMGALRRGEVLPFSYTDPLHGAGRTAVLDDDGTTLMIPAAEGLPVYPTAPGIAHRDNDGALAIAHADGSVTRYAGLAALRVDEGDHVIPDTPVGTVAPGSAPQLGYEVTRDGIRTDAATLRDDLLAPPGSARLAALLRAISSDPDPAYSTEARQRDSVEVAQRIAWMARPSEDVLANLDLLMSQGNASGDPVLDEGFDDPAGTGSDAVDLDGLASHAFHPALDGERQASPQGGRQAKPEVAPAPKAPDPGNTTLVTPGSTLPGFPKVGPTPDRDGSGEFGTEPPTAEARAFRQTMLNRAAWADSIGMHNAARHLRHFFGASGVPLTPNTKDLLTWDWGTRHQLKEAMRTQLLPFARAAMRKVTAEEGTFQLSTPWRHVEAKSPDWYAALGTFSISVSSLVRYRKIKDGRYYFEIESKMNVYDRYNWDPGKADVYYYYWGVNDDQMADFHRQGTGRDYEVRGRTNIDTYRYLYDPRTGKFVPYGKGHRPLRREPTVEKVDPADR